MPTPTHNVLLPFVLPPAALAVADRFVTTLMTLLEAVGALAIAAVDTPTAAGQAAQILFFHLTNLVTTLIRISALGLPTPRAPRPATPPSPSAAPAAPPAHPARRLPRHPGWLLVALPDIAPAVAADLGLIVADPAFIALLDAVPSLQRSLRPLLRALALTKSPDAPPPPSTPPHPVPPTPSAAEKPSAFPHPLNPKPALHPPHFTTP